MAIPDSNDSLIFLLEQRYHLTHRTSSAWASVQWQLWVRGNRDFHFRLEAE